MLHWHSHTAILSAPILRDIIVVLAQLWIAEFQVLTRIWGVRYGVSCSEMCLGEVGLDDQLLGSGRITRNTQKCTRPPNAAEGKVSCNGGSGTKDPFQ